MTYTPNMVVLPRPAVVVLLVKVVPPLVEMDSPPNVAA